MERQRKYFGHHTRKWQKPALQSGDKCLRGSTPLPHHTTPHHTTPHHTTPHHTTPHHTTPHHTTPHHTTPHHTTPHHTTPRRCVPADRGQRSLSVVMPLHSIGDLLKTFKPMLEYTNNLELKSTMLSFADTHSNVPKRSPVRKFLKDQLTFTPADRGMTCMAYWRDPVTGMGASGCSNPFLKK